MDKGIEALINEAKQSSFVMEYISNFQPEDIDSDDVDLRFEADGIDTGCDVSIVDQCSKAATLIDALIAALEQARRQNKLHERAEFTFMNALNLPDTAGRNEILAGILAVNYSLSAANRHIAELESAPNGMMQLSNELAEMKRKCVELGASNNPMTFSESYDADECRAFAWEHLKGLLGTEGWTVGDSCNYYGFYCWGWDMRRQYNEQRAAGGTVEGSE